MTTKTNPQTPTTPTPVSLLDRLYDLGEFSEAHREEWRNEVARDLNHLVGRAIYWIETDGDEIDSEFGAAVLRTVNRVVEFEEIDQAKDPSHVRNGALLRTQGSSRGEAAWRRAQ